MKQTNLKNLIKAGRYDWINSDINDTNFPDFKDMPEGKTELVHFGRFISSNDVIEELKKKGMRPANLKELLIFGKENPEEQRKFPIVALGSVCRRWFGARLVPGLWRLSGGRSLSLGCFGGGWDEGGRFLGVREVKTAGSLDSPSKPLACEDKNHLEAVEFYEKVKGLVK